MKLKVSPMASKQKSIELADRIFAGMQKAIRTLYEKEAANNELMAVSIDGKAKRLPAKELLARMNANK